MPGADDALVALGAWMDQARQLKHLPDPAVQTAENNEANSALYVRALRSLLASLGYIEQPETDGQTQTGEQTNGFTIGLRMLVRDFQYEAGLKRDSWAGPSTKLRLQQLLGFEEAQDLDQWGEIGERPGDFNAVHRAVYARLHAYGFLDQRIEKGTKYRADQNPAVADALQRFMRFAIKLGLADPNAVAAIDRPTLQVLFAHDALIAALGAHTAVVSAPTYRRQVDAIGQVELWLLGYAVVIGTALDAATVGAALDDLAKKFPSAEIDRRSGFDAHFFRQIAALDESSDEVEDAAVQDALLKTASDGERATIIVERLGQLAGNLWDGVKRLWSWLKAAVRRGVELVQDALWNVARFIASRARESYEAVVRAVDVLHRGFGGLERRLQDGSDPEQAMLLLGIDFDAKLLVNRQAASESSRQLAQRDKSDASRMEIACRILGVLVRAVRQVRKGIAVAAALGWFVLLIGLSRIVRELRSMRGEIASLSGFEFAAKDSLFKNPVR